MNSKLDMTEEELIFKLKNMTGAELIEALQQETKKTVNASFSDTLDYLDIITLIKEEIHGRMSF